MFVPASPAPKKIRLPVPRSLTLRPLKSCRLLLADAASNVTAFALKGLIGSVYTLPQLSPEAAKTKVATSVDGCAWTATKAWADVPLKTYCVLALDILLVAIQVPRLELIPFVKKPLPPFE